MKACFLNLIKKSEAKEQHSQKNWFESFDFFLLQSYTQISFLFTFTLFLLHAGKILLIFCLVWTLNSGDNSYKRQTYRNSHLFGKSVSPCIFLILIYTDQEHTGTHTFSKCAGKVSDLKRCEFLYVLATHVIWSGTYKNLHLFKILWKQSYQFRCESLYVPCLYI